MKVRDDRVIWVMNKIGREWEAFQESYAGLPDSVLMELGVTGDWSVRDILAHVTTWDEEALKYLPVIMEGGQPPKYVMYGGIDAFNAQMTERKKDLSLSEVRKQLEETHRRLINLLEGVPADRYRGENRFRRRLRLDTYSHYSRHAEAIREWREQRMPG